MSRVSADSPAPRHRAAPVTPGAEGAVAPSLAWKVCAVLPLVLLCVLMSVKIADGIGKDDTKESSQTPGVIASDPSTPTTPGETSSETESDKERQITGGALEPSELPDGAIPSETLIPDSGFEMPPGDIDQTATPVPIKKPTKKPTPSPTQSPTPTPDEAREQCIASGISALNIAALAACIADRMDPNG